MTTSQALYDVINDSWLTVFDTQTQWVVAEQLDVPPAFENSNAGYFKISGYKSLGIDGALLNYNSGADKFDETVFSVKEITVTLDVYSVDTLGSAEDILNNVALALSFQSVNDAFNAAGFAVMYVSELRDLSRVISARWNKRFQMDIVLSTNLSISDQIERIVTAPIKGTFN